MKKLLFAALGLITFVSCAKQPCDLRHTKWAYDATIYELNTRQATEEGTFAAAEKLLPELKESGVLTTYETEKADNIFEGMTFVLTGTLPTLSRDAATAIIEKHGGKASSSVSAKTTYVVAGEKAGSKLVKAQNLGVKIIDEEALLQMAGE